MASTKSEFGQVFIIGVGRSGTTLLRTLLDGHSQLCVTPEAHFVYPMLCYSKHYDQGGFDQTQFVHDLMRSGSFGHWHMTMQQLNSLSSKVYSTKDALANIYAGYAQINGKPVAIDKTPSLTQHIAYLSEVFPDSRFVHMIRDGRDVAISQYEAGWTKSVYEAAVDWTVRTEIAYKTGQSLGTKRYVELRYEDLISKPSVELRKLCHWLGLQYESQMIEQRKKTAQNILPSVYRADLHTSLVKTIGVQRPKGTTKHRQMAELVAHDQLKKLGYECDTNRSIVGKIVFGYWYTRKFGLAKLRQASWGSRLPRHY